MRQIQFRFRLKSKIDSELICVCIELYNEMNGLINFPIELDKWEILSIDQYTGINDINEKKIYENDNVKFIDSLYHKKRKISGVVGFQDGSFVIKSETVTHYRWMDYEVELVTL